MHPINNIPCGIMSITNWFCMTKCWGSTIKAKPTNLQINGIVYVHDNFSLHLCLNHNDSSYLPGNPTSVVVEKACCVFALRLSCENIKIINEVQSYYLYGCVSAYGKTSLCLRIYSKLHYLLEASVYIYIFFWFCLVGFLFLFLNC